MVRAGAVPAGLGVGMVNGREGAGEFVGSAAPGAAGHGDGVWLFSLCLSRGLTHFIYMVYAACLPVLTQAWDMSAMAAGSVATGFQIGHAVSLLFFSWLADRIGARRSFLASTLLSGLAAILFGLFARSFLSALLLFSLLGLVKGGTYTPAVMLVADRIAPARRGSAVGWLIGISSISYAASLLVTGTILAAGDYRTAFMVAAAGPVLGALLGWSTVWRSPDRIHPRTGGFDLRADIVRNPRVKRLIGGYVFHCWELIGMTAWAPAFLAASLAMNGMPAAESMASGAYLTVALHVTGLFASAAMGHLSDRFGRRAVLVATAAGGAFCSFAFGWQIGWPAWLLAASAGVYGFMVVGDSPVLSAALTEAARPGYLGATLAVRAVLGFCIGAASPILFGAVLDWANGGSENPTVWGWSFATLGLGGVLAALCAWGLPRNETGRRNASRRP